jgi:hypothetical protein
MSQDPNGIDRNIDRDMQLITCIQFERRNWEDMDLCKIHLQFYVPTPYPHPQDVEIPQGTCVYEQSLLEEPPLFSEKGIDAGASIILTSAQRELHLSRVHDGAAGVSYFVDPCTEEDFPFGEIFDIEVSGSTLPEGVPPFVLRDAIYFGSDMTWDLSQEELSLHDRSQDWPLSWSFTHEKPQASQSKRRLTVENGEDRLMCTPDEEELLLSHESLEQLAHSNESMVSFEEMILGPSKTLPWGMEYHSVMIFRSSGYVSWD